MKQLPVFYDPINNQIICRPPVTGAKAKRRRKEWEKLGFIIKTDFVWELDAHTMKCRFICRPKHWEKLGDL